MNTVRNIKEYLHELRTRILKLDIEKEWSKWMNAVFFPDKKEHL